MSRWFRHYAGMARDEKLVRAAVRSKQTVERVVWVWCAILESAAEINDGGRFELDPAEVAYFLRADEGDISAVVGALEDLGRVRSGIVANWGDRQFQSDKSADRQRKYRNKTGRHDNVDTAQGDGDVTAEDRHVTVASPPSDAPIDRVREQILEKESKKEDIRLVAEEATQPRSTQFDEFWKAYPKRDGSNPKEPARKLFLAALKSGSTPAEIMEGLRRYAEKERKNIGTPYIPQAVKWLRNRYWEDNFLPENEPRAGPTQVRVSEGTPEWDAWCAYWRETKGINPPVSNGGWYFPSSLPPGFEPQSEAAE